MTGDALNSDRRLYLATDGNRRLWVAVDLGDTFYVYDAHTGRFHRSEAVWHDFYHGGELTYCTITAAEALSHIDEGVGSYDGRRLRDLLMRHRSDPRPVTVTEALGAAASR